MSCASYHSVVMIFLKQRLRVSTHSTKGTHHSIWIPQSPILMDAFTGSWLNFFLLGWPISSNYLVYTYKMTGPHYFICSTNPSRKEHKVFMTLIFFYIRVPKNKFVKYDTKRLHDKIYNLINLGTTRILIISRYKVV